MVKFLGIKHETRRNYGRDIKLEIFRLSVESKNSEKFHLGCKLIHELATNIYESFKVIDNE